VPIGIAAALMAALTYGAVAAVQAAVIRRHGLRSLMMVVVLIGYLVGWALHLVAIDHLPLYLAQVIVSSSLVVTAVIAAFVLGEPLRREHWAAVVAMVLGLSLLAMASGRVGSSDFDSTTTMELYVALVVTGVLGWLTWRWQHPISGVVLGILSGVAYGISPIGSRTLIDFNWDHLNSYATALSIGFSLVRLPADIGHRRDRAGVAAPDSDSSRGRHHLVPRPGPGGLVADGRGRVCCCRRCRRGALRRRGTP
jgi:drug/metabolite transporter (DMT)-like permease